jgi:adenine-specific DNA methylase
MPSFIETQFPIARLSAESYKERKAGASQTLTGLGKWWGRKPLILVRASIIGMLMPASSDPKKDREIFLKILTMDDDGVWERCNPSVKRRLFRVVQDDLLKNIKINNFFEFDEANKFICNNWSEVNKVLSTNFDSIHQFLEFLSKKLFSDLSYAERITSCERPENISGPSNTSWSDINTHLGTTATSIIELVQQLGKRTFGHNLRVGDSFCGGGSIPFEAARIGCDSFGSDLNPVAGLLTLASLKLLGGGKSVQDEIKTLQKNIFQSVDKQISRWEIEHNDKGERAEVFLYCVEVKPEGCDYFIPLAPSWVISERYRIVATWDRVEGLDRLQPNILTVNDSELKLYKGKKGATVGESRVIDPFDPTKTWSVEALRGPNGLRLWSNDDLVPRPGDVFQERLYCIRWINAKGERRYAAPDAADLEREAKVIELLRERFANWQSEGFIPSKVIETGYNTDQPIRERGWTHWHHLFTPRQLLVAGMLSSGLASKYALALPRIGNLADFNSRLTRYPSTRETINNTFSNQALNTMFNFPCRGLTLCENVFVLQASVEKFSNLENASVKLSDARDISDNCDFWITDPPYADAVNYHELGDFFLAWYDKQLVKAFPEWIADARAELAVRGDGQDFRHAMVEIYKNLTNHMPDNGMQMVMFTHQNPAVWADLGMILWAANLKVTAAWTISTETEAAGIKKGNYVQGTVCLVLRKRIGNEVGFLYEVYPLVEDEVKKQISSMQTLDEGGEPNFNDADYQLAAYAAALKVLTQYGNLDGKDVEHEVFALRERNQKSDFQIVIERALGIACDTLIPKGLENSWRDLSLVERYYLRALDIESRGERRQGMYEELARGFGVTDIKPLLKSDKANGARMFTPSGLASTQLGIVGDSSNNETPVRRGRSGGTTHPFASSPLRHLMFAIRETANSDNSPEPGRQYLRDTFGQLYWTKRDGFIGLLEWLSSLGNTDGMEEWANDSEAARILAGRLRNDHA